MGRSLHEGQSTYTTLIKKKSQNFQFQILCNKITAFLGSTGELTRWKCREVPGNDVYRAATSETSKAEVTQFGDAGRVKNVNK